MSNKIILKKSAVTAKIPTSNDLDYGELALNYADGILYYKNSSNIISAIGNGAIVPITGQIDGGSPFSIYAGVTPIDGGGI